MKIEMSEMRYISLIEHNIMASNFSLDVSYVLIFRCLSCVILLRCVFFVGRGKASFYSLI